MGRCGECDVEAAAVFVVRDHSARLPGGCYSAGRQARRTPTGTIHIPRSVKVP
jgi:hypothetical protein